MSSITALSRRKKKRFEVRRRNKNEPGLLPQSQARELFVIRVRGNNSLRWTTQREKFFSTRDQRKSQKLHEPAVLLEYHLCGTDHRGRWSIKSKTISWGIQNTENFYRCLPSQPSPEEKKKRFEVRRRNKNETGLLPQSQARELFVIRVRGNHSLRWTTQRKKFFSTRDQRKSQKLHERAVLLEYHLCGTDHRGRWSINSKTIS